MGSTWRRAAAVPLLVEVAIVAIVATGTGAAASVAPDSGVVGAEGGRDAPAGTSSPAPSPSRWVWPLRPQPQVLARFDPPEVAWGSGHRGVDLAAAVGQEVLAPAAGMVTFSGVVVDRGVVVVETSAALRATFEPVEAGLPVGTVVVSGQPVARVAATPGHCAPATCLHWGVLRGDTYLDPLTLVGPTRVVLLPLWPP